MKKFFSVLLVVFCVFTMSSCLSSTSKEVLRVRLFYDTDKERNEIISQITELLSQAESKCECENRLLAEGYVLTEEFYENTRCKDRFFAAGYYDTFCVGEGKNACQFIAYPAYIYQSMEEYNNARYGSFFYEIIKKMEERY